MKIEIVISLYYDGLCTTCKLLFVNLSSFLTSYFQVAFTFWLLRYVFTLVVFILGIKAPGIRQEYNSRIPIPDEEAPQVC